MQTSFFDLNHPFFSSKKKNEILVISFKEKPLLHLVDLEKKQALFDFLDLVGRSDGIRVLVFMEPQTKMGREEYIDFYRTVLTDRGSRTCLERLYNAVGQLVLKLVRMDPLVVHADSGNVIHLFMNIGLACDYRIVTEDTVFQNPNIEIDMIPKGGGVFFLSKMKGDAVASQILYSGKDIEAAQACHLGIVDQVVPGEKLYNAALEAARRFASLPKGYATGIKKLLQFNYRELPDFLEFENECLRKRYTSTIKANGTNA